ncbi:protein kinase [Patescibacteria group bacterium]|nr:protein kinase [Patescibacteria group bacterium]
MEASQIDAWRYVACLNLDSGKLIDAIQAFLELRDWEALQNVLRLAKLYGNTKAVWEIRKIGIEQDIAGLQVPDFAEWFKASGIKWFDLYYDEKQGVSFIEEEDAQFIYSTIDSLFDPDEFWSEVLRGSAGLKPERMALLKCLAEHKEPVVDTITFCRQNVDERFRAYCARNGLAILKKLQDGIEGIRRCSNVYLVLDADGIVKIYKEVLEYSGGRLGDIFSREDEIYEHLPQADFLPRYYGTVQVDEELVFLKESVHYGQPLSDYMQRHALLSVAQKESIILSLAKQLEWLHRNGVWYLDIKPENIHLNEDGTLLFDLGISRIVKDETEVDIYLAEPRYAAPEGATRLVATETSDVFQLGVLFCELLTGEHPFASDNSETASREEEILKYSLASAFSKQRQCIDIGLDILDRMLEKNPEKRATLAEVINALEGCGPLPKKRGKRIPRSNPDQCILFPARMGIPHKGHINYISRLIELGFHVIISIQRSYTITERDPIPKWLVMKMVGQSLLDRGFSEKDFSFILTPYYNTRQELQMHFAMMPGMEKVIGVASSNPDVHELFSCHNILGQKAVFAFEGQEYEDLSWGEIVRGAARDRDYKTFKEYAAGGVEEILSFDKIRKMYGKPPIEFVPGVVRVVLTDAVGKIIVKGRVFRYSDTEKSLIWHVNRSGHNAQIIGAYNRDTVVRMDGCQKYLKYLKTEFDGEDENIYFVLYA